MLTTAKKSSERRKNNIKNNYYNNNYDIGTIFSNKGTIVIVIVIVIVNMLLITHAITAAALASIQKSIPAAFAIGLVSHYLLDMIPHYDHNIESFKNKNNPRDIKKTLALIALDGASAVIAPLLLFWPTNLEQFLILSAAIIGSVLPDLLQGVYLIFPQNKFIASHQQFQEWIHSKIRINHIPHIAIPLQIGFNLAFVWVGKFLG